MRAYQNLEVWKLSLELAKEVYLQTKTFPKEELFSLTLQCKKAAISISANIAEGMGRQYKKDTLQFLYIARGSVYELENLLRVAVIVEVMEEIYLDHLLILIDQIVKLLNGLIKYIRNAPLK